MKNTYLMQINKNILLGLLILLPIISSAQRTPIQDHFQKRHYGRILTTINSHNNRQLKNAEDYRICGETSFLFGLYKEACFYFDKAFSMDKQILKDQDLIHYAFSLMKTDAYSKVLTEACFNPPNKPGTWLEHLKKIATSHDSYAGKKSKDLNQKPIDIQFLSQYGIEYFDKNIYYSYPRAAGDTEGMLVENALINSRRNELSGIKKTAINENGVLETSESEIVERKLAGSARIATMQVIDENGNSVSTVVAQKGKPERIVVHGKLLPEFSFNSQYYACAMPYFDKQTQRLYFCSDMNGGIGGWDIYYSTLEAGKWGKPVNMGEKVNTPFDELFPSISDSLLVFSSEAREGFGGFDNYSYSFTDSSVANLWPFNTEGDDLCLKFIKKDKVQAVGVNSSGAKFFQSQLDLTSILHLDEEKTEDKPKVTVVEKPLITEKLPEKSIVKEAPDLVIKNVKPAEVKTKPELSQVSIDGDVFLGNIYYDLNSAVFRSSDYSKLDSVAAAIKRNGMRNIIIWSFTDRCGAEQYNGNLSFQRALGIAEYLKNRFSKEDDKVYFSVAAGEYYSKSKNDISANDRRADIYSGEKGLPYQVVYAYKPSEGETAKTIAKTFNNDYETMSQLNIRTAQGHANDDIVFVGIQGIHITSPGESLYGISQKYKCSLDQLLAANHKTKISLLVAEKLIIPLPGSN